MVSLTKNKFKPSKTKICHFCSFLIFFFCYYGNKKNWVTYTWSCNAILLNDMQKRLNFIFFFWFFFFWISTKNWQMLVNSSRNGQNTKIHLNNTCIYKCNVCIYTYIHNSDLQPPFQGGTKIWLPPLEGDSEKIKKGSGSMVQGHVFLKVCTFPIQFFQRLSFSHLEITLYKIVLCIWRKIIFFCHHNFMKKGHSKLSKNESKDIQ